MLVIVLGFAWYQTREDQSSTDRSPGGGSMTVDVDRVVDGDTAKVFIDGQSEYVRYIGVDTPESVQPEAPVECFGEESKQFNAGRIEGERMKLVFDSERYDQYDRLLAYVYVNGSLLNAEILRRGYGTTLSIPPNTARANEFSKLESEARKAGRGLWSEC